MASHKFRLLAIKATKGPRLSHSKKRQSDWGGLAISFIAFADDDAFTEGSRLAL